MGPHRQLAINNLRSKAARTIVAKIKVKHWGLVICCLLSVKVGSLYATMMFSLCHTCCITVYLILSQTFDECIFNPIVHWHICKEVL
jgi:hypothetical protein